jgi:hypothetical protein
VSRGLVLVFAAVVLIATGCGQTDFATNVGETSATLNGTITTYTEDEPTSAHFEYWKTFDPDVRHRTPSRTVTGTGPISETATQLAPDTHYSYRLCGTEGDSPAVCAQTRTFATGRDSVQAYGKTILYISAGREWVNGIDVEALRGAPGEAPLGRAFFKLGTGVPAATRETPGGSHSGPNITCLEVQGNEAIFGVRDDLDFDSLFPEQSFVRAVEGGPLGSGRDRFELFEGESFSPPRAPTDCSSPLRDAEITLEWGEVAVNDVP